MEFNDYEADVWADIEILDDHDKQLVLNESEITEAQRIGVSMLVLRGYVRVERPKFEDLSKAMSKRRSYRWHVSFTNEGRKFSGLWQRDPYISIRPGERIQCKVCSGEVEG